MSLNFKLGILEPKQSLLKIKNDKNEISSSVDKINCNVTKNEKQSIESLIFQKFIMFRR